MIPTLVTLHSIQLATLCDDIWPSCWGRPHPGKRDRRCGPVCNSILKIATKNLSPTYLRRGRRKKRKKKKRKKKVEKKEDADTKLRLSMVV